MSEHLRASNPRRFERIAKKIVRKDIESQTEDGQQFFIDKDVYERHLPDIKENIEDSSLSDFLLTYDLCMHTTELVQYFSPQSSRKRDFVNLKHFSGKYGFHLCYMALRESVSDKNDNKELVAKMRKTAITLKKVPPKDILFDSPCSSDEDVPSGQGEVPVEDCNNMDQVGKKMDGLEIKDVKGKGFKEDESNDKYDIETHRKFSVTHSKVCNCATCQRVRTESDPQPRNTADYKRSQSEYPRITVDTVTANKRGIDRLLSSPIPRPFLSPQEVSPDGNEYTSTIISGDNVEQPVNECFDYLAITKESPLSVGRSKVVSGTQICPRVDDHDALNS